MERLSVAIADWMINCGVVNKEDKELYVYASQSFIMSISPLFLAIFWGICMGGVKQGLVLIIPFMMLRKFSGGYHAKKAWVCLVCSGLLLAYCIRISLQLQYNWIWLLITVMSTVMLIVFSPIDHENRRLTQDEKRQYRKIVAILAVVFLALVMVLLLIHKNNYASCVSVGIILTAALQIPCILFGARKTEKVNDSILEGG